MGIFYGRISLQFILICLAVFSFSCSKFDKEEAVPSYISIPAIKLIVPDSLKSQQGTASAKISDAWVYINDVLQGVYELPAKFPVLKEGTNTIKIRAGIKQNGIGSTRPIYPFFNDYIENVNLNVNSTVSISPSVNYRSYTKFVWKENFESAAITITKTSASDTSFKIISNTTDVFEDQKSMAVYLDNSRNVFECKSTNAFLLNTNGTPVFMELNYKTNSPVTIGFFANSISGTLSQEMLTLNPTLNDNSQLYWNKIYVNLSDFLQDYYQSDSFNIWIRIEKAADLQLGESYFDNIKILQ